MATGTAIQQLTEEAIIEAYYRTRYMEVEPSIRDAVRLDLEIRLSEHYRLDERTIAAEFQRSVLAVTRGKDLS